MGQVIDISTYNFARADRLFLDANFWLFMYGSRAPKNEQKLKKYSRAFEEMARAGSLIFIDVLVVSEFVNRYARNEHKLMLRNERTKKKNFKKFRQSKEFAAVAKEIADIVKLTLGRCRRVGSGFESLDENTLMDEYAAGKSDFNDQVISSICAREKLKLVTDDGDFRHGEITVLTANEKMLN